MTYAEFELYLDSLNTDDYIVRIKKKYDWEKEYEYTNELLTFDYNKECYCWENDWCEGQQDVEVLWVFPVRDVEPPREWIPVSERLPEKYTHTLWCASSGYVRSDYFNGKFWEDAKKYCYEVIAWMPLPEPYKEESEDKE